MNSDEQRISIDQLRVGLFVRLETWMDHPFLFSSFKIRNEKQLKALRSLGLSDIIYLPGKSDFDPLPLPQTPAPVVVRVPEVDPEIAAMWQEKRERREKITHQREAYGRCEKQFVGSITSVKSMLRNLFSRPQESIKQAEALIVNMVDSLLAEKDVLLHLMNAKNGDDGAYYHSLNVTMLALMLGRESGLKATEMCELGLGTLLHDMGKERVPSQILLKKTPWSTAERNFYQQHVVYGLELSEKLPGLSAGSLGVIGQHHEMLDGTGFPSSLVAGRIGKLARIAAIANAFDNACNRINTADSLTPSQALSVMFKRDRVKYDSAFMQLFVRCLGVYPPGSIVRLNNDTIALVVNVNPGKLLQPTLLIYDATIPKEEALLLNLADEPDLSVVSTLRPAQLPKEVFDYLSPRNRISYFTETTKPTRPVSR
jgi:HD-GYP domain-containing protein (c-di-GMP phosphodiesterase class II)